MPQPSGAGAEMLSMSLSVPALGELRIVASDLVTKIAESFGARAAGAGAALEEAATRVAPAGSDGEIAFDFHTDNRELRIVARCGGRSTEVRCRLTS
jgi:hypothetical protein